MGTVLLLSLFFSPAGSSGLLAANPNAPPPADNSRVVLSQPVADAQDGVGNFDPMQIDGPQVTGRICMKIRAFIFETNDDQVPKFVRETTCLPVTWGAKKINADTQPKLIPADGGSRF